MIFARESCINIVPSLLRIMSRNKSVGILSALARFMVASESFEAQAPRPSRVSSFARNELLARKETYIASMAFQRWQV